MKRSSKRLFLILISVLVSLSSFEVILRADEVISVDFVSPFFEGIFQDLQDKKGLVVKPDSTNVLYEKLISAKSLKRKLRINYLAFNVEDNKLPATQKNLKLVDALEWFFTQTPLNEKKYDSQVLLEGGFNRDCSNIWIVILGVQSSRYIMQEIPIKELSSENVIDKVFSALLKELSHLNKLIPIYADELLDADNSQVRYSFTTRDKKTMVINVDYDGAHEYIQSVDISIRNPVKKEGYVGCIATKEKNDICVELSTENGKSVPKRIFSKKPMDAPFRLTAVSNAGYEIYFDFKDTDSLYADVKISPKSSPYAPYGYVMDGNLGVLQASNDPYELYLGCNGPGENSEAPQLQDTQTNFSGIQADRESYE